MEELIQQEKPEPGKRKINPILHIGFYRERQPERLNNPWEGKGCYRHQRCLEQDLEKLVKDENYENESYENQHDLRGYEIGKRHDKYFSQADKKVCGKKQNQNYIYLTIVKL